MPGRLNNPASPFVVLAPPGLFPSASPGASLATPYGPVQYYQSGEHREGGEGGEHHGNDRITWLAPAPPRALIYGAKEMGYERVVEVLPLRAVNWLLEPGDLLVPDHLVDLTHGRDMTFFVGKGYGFLPQHPPFCPVVRDALIAAGHQVVAEVPLAERPRIFVRGTYGAVVVEPESAPESALRQAGTLWGADAIGSRGVPTSFLSRELELCYALLGYVQGGSPSAAPPPLLTQVLRVLQAAAHLLPPDRACPCARAMHSTRERGIIDDDWHTWVVPAPGEKWRTPMEPSEPF
ncbi:MAG: MTAP family purine nucleoside phosphorylase [Chloroflexaceae bacterium]|nr:MTAP family purine nucleoside phosphorylase [Chloroflexaceae bacterium]